MPHSSGSRPARRLVGDGPTHRKNAPSCFSTAIGPRPAHGGEEIRRIHSFDERISIANLVAAARYVTGLIEEFAESHVA